MVVTAPSRDPRDEGGDGLPGLLLAMAALMLAATVTLVLHLLHWERGALLAAAAAGAVVVWRVRISRTGLALVGIYLAVEMVLPQHTGGGRIGDWDLHYQLARGYAGLPATITLADMRQRTPLFNALNAGVLAWFPAFWVFQLLSVLLNALWIWPARLLLRHLGAEPDRVAVIGLTPMVLLFATYTWPWGFVSFFVLSAVYGVLRGGRMGAAVSGVALAGALLAHVGSLGYVAAIAAYVLVHRRDARLVAVTGFAGCLLITPWLLITHSGSSPGSLWSGSIPGMYDGTLPEWLLSRPVMWASTFWGLPPPQGGYHILDAVLSLAFFSTTVMQLPLLLIARRRPVIDAVSLWTIAGAVIAGTLLLPTNTAKSGLAETVFTANLLLLICGVARLDAMRVRRATLTYGVMFAVATVALVWRSVIAVDGDPNVAEKVSQGLVFFADRFGQAPGIVLGVASLLLLGAGAFRSGVPARRRDGVPAAEA